MLLGSALAYLDDLPNSITVLNFDIILGSFDTHSQLTHRLTRAVQYCSTS